MELDGAHVLLTGASTGIGAALAPMLASEGAVVGLVARRADLLDEVLAACRQAGSSASRRYVCDLSDPAAAEALVHRAWEEMDGLDALVNNAAMPKRKHVLRITPDEVDATMTLNFGSPVRMTLAVLPRMLERGRGTVVMVGSMAGRLGTPREAAYSASKFALSGFAESMSIDLSDTPLAVRLVSPGAIETPIWDQPDNEPSSYGGPFERPETVAAAVVAALRGDTGFETYAPADLKGVVEFKTANIDAFLAGAADFDRAASAD